MKRMKVMRTHKKINLTNESTIQITIETGIRTSNQNSQNVSCCFSGFFKKYTLFKIILDVMIQKKL